MPRKRTELDRSEKVEEILGRAVELLNEGGYDDLTINRVARDLGLARAAVYWYFPSREELFVAACARVFADAFADPPARGGYLKRIAWGADRFAGIYEIYSALQARAPGDPAAAEVLRSVQASICTRLSRVLEPHVPADRLDDMVETVVVLIEGLLGRRLPTDERNRRLEFALKALLDESRD